MADPRPPSLLSSIDAAQQAQARRAMSHSPQAPITGRQAADAMQAMGLLTAPIPVVGDIVGLLGDAAMYATKPEERTLGNAALTALGALPFMPSLAGKLGRAGRTLDVTDKATFDAVKKALGGKAPEGEIRQAVAQYNASLPRQAGGLGLEGGNTPMQRATALGFTQPALHGTAADIREFDVGLRGSSTGNARSAKMATWAVDDEATARGYADNAAVYVPVKRLLDQADKAANAGKWDRYDELVAQAEALEAADNRRGQNIMPLLIAPRNQKSFDVQGGEFTDLEGGLGQNMIRAKAQGATSVMFRNLSDHPLRNNVPANHTGVFDPADIRSRFAAFDPVQRSSRNILASLAGAGLLGPSIVAGTFDEEQ